MNTAQTKNLARSRFTVVVGQRSLRSESAARSDSRDEVGIRQLIYAVRPLFNGRAKTDASSVYAVEFDVKCGLNTSYPMAAFPARTQARLAIRTPLTRTWSFPTTAARPTTRYPWLIGIQLDYRLANRQDTDQPDATDVMAFDEE